MRGRGTGPRQRRARRSRPSLLEPAMRCRGSRASAPPPRAGAHSPGPPWDRLRGPPFFAPLDPTCDTAQQRGVRGDDEADNELLLFLGGGGGKGIKLMNLPRTPTSPTVYVSLHRILPTSTRTAFLMVMTPIATPLRDTTTISMGIGIWSFWISFLVSTPRSPPRRQHVAGSLAGLSGVRRRSADRQRLPRACQRMSRPGRAHRTRCH